ncbi:MAG: glycosyl transferase group 1 [Chitinophagaceae bacterium]|nr:glycosyl transferase group 1 [Chitinophagaceae bacterium]
MNKKILFVANQVKDRSPAQRFRFEQYFDYLSLHGYDCELAHLLTGSEAKIFYSKGNAINKAWIVVKSFFRRYRQCARANEYDIVFIQREAFITGTIFFEKMLRRSKAKMVFDFDDAVWLQSVSDINRKFAFLKNPDKTAELIKMADRVIAGNAYLANYAGQFNQDVIIIPTTIDTNEYRPDKQWLHDEPLVIGWSGSFSTIQHFKYALPVLKKLQAKYGNRLLIKVIGDSGYKNEELNLVSLDWNKKEELRELNSFHIGIMPLPDDEWSKGKCGLKGLQYMALGIPTVMSPVGVNSEIITDGVNGFLAADEQDWIDKISLLVDNKETREKLGRESRQTVIAKYSVESQKDTYLNCFNELLVKGK